MEISFSIILPVRNGGELVKECIQSVLAQTRTNFNFLILDNNSFDGTTEYIRSINDSRIVHLRSQTDLAMPDNWKRALELPLNEYITFIGHDDRLHTNYLEEMYRLINAHPDASLYQTHFNYIDESSLLIRPCKRMPEKISVAGYLQGQFLQTMDSTGTGFLFRSGEFRKLGGYDYTIPNLIFSDYKLYAQLTGLSYQAVSSEICFDYRVHNSLSKSTDIDLYRIAFEKYTLFLKEYREESPSAREVIEKSGPEYLQFYCRSLSHRLLKSTTNQRRKVGPFVQDCRKYASWLGISAKFHPYSTDLSILAASIIDSNILTRSIYRKIRNLTA